MMISTSLLEIARDTLLTLKIWVGTRAFPCLLKDILKQIRWKTFNSETTQTLRSVTLTKMVILTCSVETLVALYSFMRIWVKESMIRRSNEHHGLLILKKVPTLDLSQV